MYLAAARLVVVLRLVKKAGVRFFVHTKAVVHYFVFALAQTPIHFLDLSHRRGFIGVVNREVGLLSSKEKKWRDTELVTHTRCIVPNEIKMVTKQCES